MKEKIMKKKDVELNNENIIKNINNNKKEKRKEYNNNGILIF